MRTPIIAGNWKLNKTVPEAVELCRQLEALLDGAVDREVVVCPSFTALSAVQALGLVTVKHGAQNMAAYESGAYTGEVSAAMLRDVGCQYVILGHSERRELFGETDEAVNTKARLALRSDIKPIICVGETLEQRRSGETEDVVLGQLTRDFDGIDVEDAARIVVAYEPIWAIGTGETASGEDANTVISAIRRKLAVLYDADTAASIRIQYGGSVKPNNIREFMEYPDIDGALVGGASLRADDFVGIVQCS